MQKDQDTPANNHATRKGTINEQLISTELDTINIPTGWFREEGNLLQLSQLTKARTVTVLGYVAVIQSHGLSVIRRTSLLIYFQSLACANELK